MGVLNYEVDIHGLTTDQAKKLLERTISSLSNQYGQITVIHGYQAGNQLQIMVRKTLKHHRIKQKILTLNRGETVLLIREKSADKAVSKKVKKR